MQHDRMKEEVMVVGKLVCFMSPECLTHTCGTEVRPRIKIPWVSVQHGDGKVQLYYMQKRMMGPERKTRRIRGRSRILWNMKSVEEALRRWRGRGGVWPRWGGML